jgi:hypothetical protein
MEHIDQPTQAIGLFGIEQPIGGYCCDKALLPGLGQQFGELAM